MPKIKINEASKGTNMISSGTVESHWTAAEVLANLSSAGGGPREEKFDNPISILQEEKTNIDPSTNERFPRTVSYFFWIAYYFIEMIQLTFFFVAAMESLS